MVRFCISFAHPFKFEYYLELNQIGLVQVFSSTILPINASHTHSQSHKLTDNPRSLDPSKCCSLVSVLGISFRLGRSFCCQVYVVSISKEANNISISGWIVDTRSLASFCGERNSCKTGSIT